MGRLVGFSSFAKGILKPLSFGILLFFGVIFNINKLKAKKEDKVKAQ
jgi:hypothetical protein